MERLWHPPSGAEKADGGLVLYNSLLDQKVPFVPIGGPNSKQITWYTCGPTVYDSAHMGHARNYVTFDIVRRVLEDYFGYSCTFVMNVTDVDDKIILRARRGFLLNQYRESVGADAARVIADCRAAVAAAQAKQKQKVSDTEKLVSDQEAALAAPAAAGGAGGGSGKRVLDELRTALDQERLKLTKVEEAGRGVEAVGGDGPTAVAAALAAGGDYLAEDLDRRGGGGVTDPDIFRKHAAKYEAEFLEDMESLGVRPPDVLTRVSEYIPEIVDYVLKIVQNGLAYESNGSVYFDTQAFREKGHVYGKLNPWAVGSAALASEGEADFETREKRGAADFALWKAAKPGEPSWESPWGRGRPGWHIECSAMASAVLGRNMDIHSGGSDLRFPHHDNELAQAEAFYHEEMASSLEAHRGGGGCAACRAAGGGAPLGHAQWVNYFLHSGHLGIEGLKMSKSLKNFVTIRQALESFTPRQLRLLFLLQPWERAMTYGESAKEEMRSRESVLKNFFANIDVALRGAGPYGGGGPARWAPEERELHAAVLEAEARVHASLSDNVNTRGAMDALGELIKSTNIYLSKRSSPSLPPQPLLLRRAAAYVTRILTVFGLVPHAADRPGLGAEGQGGGGAGGGTDSYGKYLDAFVAFRDQIRSLARAKAPPSDILACCDAVRDAAMVDLGVRLEDRPGGAAAWKPEDPAVLRAEREERRREAAQARLKKASAALQAKQRDLEKLQKLASLPPIAEALSAKYRFAEDGVTPTHDKEGAVLEGKALDKAMKDVDKEKKVRAPLAKRVEEEGEGCVGRLAAEVAEMEEEVRRMEGEGGGDA